jgi:hypothetical protein
MGEREQIIRIAAKVFNIHPDPILESNSSICECAYDEIINIVEHYESERVKELEKQMSDSLKLYECQNQTIIKRDKEIESQKQLINRAIFLLEIARSNELFGIEGDKRYKEIDSIVNEYNKLTGSDPDKIK